MKFFNTTGRCRKTKHYMLPATQRLEIFDLERLIAQEAYFVLHAPRQTGKTTAMVELARQLNESGEYIGIVVSMKAGAAFSDDVGAAEDAILSSWHQAIRAELPKELHPSLWKTDAPAGQRIGSFLSEWALEALCPLVVLIDEFDFLEGRVLISVLSQLRSGFNHRPTAFPSSVVLVGLHDVWNYKGGSAYSNVPPFNIVSRSMTLRNFTTEEVCTLWVQHTAETGQQFDEGVLQRVFELTKGQPCLVNALAKVCVEELVRDITMPVEVEHVNEANEILIQRRQALPDIRERTSSEYDQTPSGKAVRVIRA